METLTELVRLLDATADDRWRPGHPSTRPRESAADRAHDATRPADPTADAVCDPARLQLAEAWQSALRYVQSFAAMPRGSFRATALVVCEQYTAEHLAALESAHAWWLGHAPAENPA
jgi:hypothetical protein